MSSIIRKRALLVIVLGLSILASCSRQTTNSVSGRVVKIVDGDTITILDARNTQHKIRLQGIDAPERTQAFGQVSKQNLANLVFGKIVNVEYTKVDRWDRKVGKVWIDGKDECLEQIKAGLAWHYKHYEKEQSPADRQLYVNAEQEARAQKRGVWHDQSPIPPWDFRHHTSGSSADTDLDEAIPPSHHFSNLPSSTDRNSANAPTPIASLPRTFNATGEIRGNKRTKIYHLPGCRNYDDIAPHNRVPFRNLEDAQNAGYRAAKNCP